MTECPGLYLSLTGLGEPQVYMTSRDGATLHAIGLGYAVREGQGPSLLLAQRCLHTGSLGPSVETEETRERLTGDLAYVSDGPVVWKPGAQRFAGAVSGRMEAAYTRSGWAAFAVLGDERHTLELLAPGWPVFETLQFEHYLPA